MLKYEVVRILRQIVQGGVSANLGSLQLNSELFGGNETQIMKTEWNTIRANIDHRCKPIARFLLTLMGSLVFFLLTFGNIQAKTEWPHVVFSKDGTPISYEVCGAGKPTLVFVYGWSCDALYWRAQVPYFSKNHRVVTLDIAGHSHSGMTRTRHTMSAFGEDVQAITDATNSQKVILIGNSVGY